MSPEREPRNIERERREPYIWVTWLSRMMAGEASCNWSAWFKTNYPKRDEERVPSDFNLASWQIAHTRMLSELISEQRKEGKRIFKEQQFQFRRPDLILAGKPDLIVFPSPEEIEIFDCKTGQQKVSDQVQVMIYMGCLPQSKGPWEGKKIRGGHIIYKKTIMEIPPEAVNQKFTEDLSYFLAILTSKTPPEKNPSEHECRFCDISQKACPERV